MKYTIALITFSFFLVAFDRKDLIPKEGTLEYISFIEGEYKLLSFRVDPITEETILNLHDVKGRFAFEIRRKFDRGSPLTMRTKQVYVLTSEVFDPDPTEHKFYINFIGVGENGDHLWSQLSAVYIRKKVEEKKKEKQKGYYRSLVTFIPLRRVFYLATQNEGNRNVHPFSISESRS